MAFAVTNRYDVVLGGNLKAAIGSWSGNEGDATGTITVTGGRAVGALIYTQDTNGVTEWTRWQGAAGASVGTVDISVFNRATVVAGTFIIFYQ